MKVHQFARGIWEHEPSLALGCKRLRPLAPKLQPDHPDNNDVSVVATFDLKSFIRPDNGSSKKHGSADNNKDSAQEQIESHTGGGGGTRWNPTQEQIRILEMLYGGGMRTPNAQQIEEISKELSKYGKIEGKNVFYWFQNHKARDRQKQKRINISCPNQTPTLAASVTSTMQVYTEEEEGMSILKRKCKTWTFECLEEEDKRNGREEEGDRTLLLFPLHPESS